MKGPDTQSVERGLEAHAPLGAPDSAATGSHSRNLLAEAGIWGTHTFPTDHPEKHIFFPTGFFLEGASWKTFLPIGVITILSNN